ncbi:DcaP family trimeric outer membrane transporter [Azoarcus sp. KH32C]|uniref:DcaP family trimeric outer membrane transporter n=1 Tax=Azoarcus sp. KH32C TaxID=748247 RepID=UPI0002386D7E|nr:DcaP family trimeric outer membrane transporter [Azoarcus sp. KH32C]BAL23883.1 hypothetical protein AZKH_1562 [Azoarcus sp. KH32C]
MRKVGTLCAALMAAGLMSNAAHADEAALRAQIAELRAHLEALEAQIKTIDANVGAVPKTFNLVTKGDEEGTFKLPGSETSVGLYGFIHVDGYKDFGARTGDWAFEPGTIAIKDDPSGLNSDTRKGKFNLSARVTRFGAKTSTPTDMGALRTKLEFDFYEYGDTTYKSGYTNGYNPRLRHAYGELEADWGTLLVGQTWSTFMNLDATPETADFNGHGSAQLARQPMVRLSESFDSLGTVSVAVENAATMINGQKPLNTPNLDKRPDLTVGWNKTGDFGSVGANALLTRYSYDDNVGTTDGRNAYGVSVGGAFKITDKDSLLGLYTAGNGIARYLPSANYNWEVFDGDKIRLSMARAVTVGWARAWTEKVRTNLSWGRTRLDVDSKYLAAYGPSANETLTHAFANVFWAFTQNAELGLEYAWGERELNTGETGTFRRLQTSMHYSF